MQGRHGAVSVVALAEKGALFDPGPCMYMEKLAFGPQIDPELVSLDQPISFNLKVNSVCLIALPSGVQYIKSAHGQHMS